MIKDILNRFVMIENTTCKIIYGLSGNQLAISLVSQNDCKYLSHYKNKLRFFSRDEIDNLKIPMTNFSFIPVKLHANVYNFKCSKSNFKKFYISKGGIISQNEEIFLKVAIYSFPSIGDKIHCKGEVYVVVPGLNGESDCVSLYNEVSHSYFSFNCHDLEHLDNLDEVSSSNNFKFTLNTDGLCIVTTTKNNSGDCYSNDNNCKMENCIPIDIAIGSVNFNCFSRYFSEIERKINEISTISNASSLEIRRLSKIVEYNFPVTNVPPAVGSLRQLQLWSLDMLDFLDRICRKHNISYWLEGGTLIGAVRHKGFIPWDDDVDVNMMIDDFTVLQGLLNSEKGYYLYPDVPIYLKNFEPTCYRLYNSNNNSWLDIFVFYYIPDDMSIDEHKMLFAEMKKNALLIRESEGVSAYRKYVLEREKQISSPSKSKFIFKGIEYYWKKYFCYESNLIFPLKEMKFENITCMVPNRSDEYLKIIFGDYITYPDKISPKHVKDLTKISLKE